MPRCGLADKPPFAVGDASLNSCSALAGAALRTALLVATPLLGAEVRATRATAKEPAAVEFPAELTKFAQTLSEPVFAAEPGRWDARIRERGWIKLDAAGYRLWYTGYDGTPTGRRMLGYATSPDGVAWTRDPANPLVDDAWIEDMTVVRRGDRFYMFAEGLDDRAQLWSSPDGVAWKHVGQLDIRLANGDPIPPGPFGTPTALFEDDRWKLFYERGDRGVWLAESEDLQTWRNVEDEPVLEPGPEDYDRDMVALNQIVKRRGRYYAYYHGCATDGPAARTWCVCLAASDDLIHWKKYPGNPLLPREWNVSSGIVVPSGTGFRLYTMHPEVRCFESTAAGQAGED